MDFLISSNLSFYKEVPFASKFHLRDHVKRLRSFKMPIRPGYSDKMMLVATLQWNIAVLHPPWPGASNSTRIFSICYMHLHANCRIRSGDTAFNVGVHLMFHFQQPGQVAMKKLVKSHADPHLAQVLKNMSDSEHLWYCLLCMYSYYVMYSSSFGKLSRKLQQMTRSNSSK